MFAFKAISSSDMGVVMCSSINLSAASILLDEIALNANMSRTYFCTVFKKLNGLSPWEYIGLKRIQMAKKLLENTRKSILEISLECGFNNISHFNRAFKGVTGRKPSEYRSKFI